VKTSSLLAKKRDKKSPAFLRGSNPKTNYEKKTTVFNNSFIVVPFGTSPNTSNCQVCIIKAPEGAVF